jgi:hypothetical protein
MNTTYNAHLLRCDLNDMITGLKLQKERPNLNLETIATINTAMYRILEMLKKLNAVLP